MATSAKKIATRTAKSSPRTQRVSRAPAATHGTRDSEDSHAFRSVEASGAIGDSGRFAHVELEELLNGGAPFTVLQIRGGSDSVSISLTDSRELSAIIEALIRVRENPIGVEILAGIDKREAAAALRLA